MIGEKLMSHQFDMYYGVNSGCRYKERTLRCLECPLPECKYVIRDSVRKNRAVGLREQGYTYREIAKELGISKPTARSWANGGTI